MAVDTKYGKVTTERGNIGEDEPVVVFRAQDKLAPQILDDYWKRCRLMGSPQEHLSAIQDAHMALVEWQQANPDLVKTPD